MSVDVALRVVEVIQAHLATYRPTASQPAVSTDSTFGADLRCDPIDMVCICLAIEDAFGIKLPADEPEHCESVFDMVSLVTRACALEDA